MNDGDGLDLTFMMMIGIRLIDNLVTIGQEVPGGGKVVFFGLMSGLM